MVQFTSLLGPPEQVYAECLGWYTAILKKADRSILERIKKYFSVWPLQFIDTQIHVFVENVQTEYTAVAERLIKER